MIPEEDINSKKDSDEVSLVCLVSSPEKQDYYIAWSEDGGQNNGVFSDGITFPHQKTKNGYSVASVYTTTKNKWNNNIMFYCNVWVGGMKEAVTPTGVSNVIGNSAEC